MLRKTAQRLRIPAEQRSVQQRGCCARGQDTAVLSDCIAAFGIEAHVCNGCGGDGEGGAGGGGSRFMKL